MTFRDPVHPHPFGATAQLVQAQLRARPFGHGLAVSHINEVLVTHGPEFVVAALVQQLSTAIASPKFNVEEWVAVEIERSEDALQMDAELHILQQNEEMKSLGIPEKYRDRLRAWANGASVEEIQDRLKIGERFQGDPRACELCSTPIDLAGKDSYWVITSDSSNKVLARVHIDCAEAHGFETVAGYKAHHPDLNVF